MANGVANSDDLNLKRFLIYSIILHLALAILVVVSAYLNFRGNEWAGVGGGSDGTKVNLVSSAGIPMPKPVLPTESQVADPTKSLYNVEPPKIEQPPPDATKIPKFDKEKPLPPSKKSKVFENKTLPPDNAVPGHGGQPNLPTGYSQTPGAPSSGVAMQGEGGGDFATRYSWYVDAVKRRISSNWMQNTIDTRVLQARTAHAVVEFVINRDGSVKNARIVQTSGNLSMDNSGIRAIQSSDPMPRLPTDFSGSYVTVTFDFDLSMKR